VTTASSIEAVVTLRLLPDGVEVVAEAVPSGVTRQFDRHYQVDLDRYLNRAAQLGLGAAGDPPRTGAEEHMSGIRILPPEALRGIGKATKLIGGTGTEWTIRWRWHHPSPSRSWNFVVESAHEIYRMALK